VDRNRELQLLVGAHGRWKNVYSSTLLATAEA